MAGASYENLQNLPYCEEVEIDWSSPSSRMFGPRIRMKGPAYPCPCG